MKRILTVGFLVLALCIMLASCSEKCEHVYDNACDESCNICAEVREVGGHDYAAADCDTPKTCKECSATEGEALGHSPEADDGDCTTAVVCSDCEMIITEAKKHDFSYTFSTTSDNTHVASGKCNNCETVLENAITLVFEVEGYELTDMKGKYGDQIFHSITSHGNYAFKIDAGEHQDTAIEYYFYLEEISEGFFGSTRGKGCVDYTIYLGNGDLYLGINIIPNVSEPITVTFSMVELLDN